ncbi:hypothetical protein ACFLXJ_04310 [Chloroflexota bacterium]
MPKKNSLSGTAVKNPVYEDTSRYDFWLKFILGSVLALTFVSGIVLLSEDVRAAAIFFGVTLFDALLFKAILPSRLQIFEDRLKIVLGGPFAINISFSKIKHIRQVSGSKTFVYGGFRLATSSRYVLEIARKKRSEPGYIPK